MEHITDTRIEQSQPTAVTLGNFDGVDIFVVYKITIFGLYANDFFFSSYTTF